MRILVCNTGSSCLEFGLCAAEGERWLAAGSSDWSTTPTRLAVRCPGQPEAREEPTLQQHAEAITCILDALQAGSSAPPQALNDVHAVGHRVVHGGTRYTAAVRFTPEVRASGA